MGKIRPQGKDGGEIKLGKTNLGGIIGKGCVGVNNGKVMVEEQEKE